MRLKGTFTIGLSVSEQAELGVANFRIPFINLPMYPLGSPVTLRDSSGLLLKNVLIHHYHGDAGEGTEVVCSQSDNDTAALRKAAKLCRTTEQDGIRTHEYDRPINFSDC